MYSFGVIIYEIVTGTTPFCGFKLENFDELVFQKHGRPPMDYDIYGRDIKANPVIKDFIQKCWDKDFLKRPTAKTAFELFSNLEQIEIKKKNNEKFFITKMKQLLITRKDSI
jgi:serine/threonine protein kinase